MTRDDIIRMAREAGLKARTSEITRFAALVAAAEREACALTCEDMEYQRHESAGGAITECAAAIRSRQTA